MPEPDDLHQIHGLVNMSNPEPLMPLMPCPEITITDHELTGTLNTGGIALILEIIRTLALVVIAVALVVIA